MNNPTVIPKLNYSKRSREFNKYTDEQKSKCVFAYLFENRSHRWLDENILQLDKEESKGYQSMGILHFLGSYHTSLFF